MTERPLQGKVALVTGSSRGVGRAIAVALAEEGADAVITARTISPRGDDLTGTILETAAAIEETGVSALPLAADLSRPEDRERLVNETLERFGRIDILVNNAADTGDNVFRGFWETTPEDWTGQMDLNLNSMYYLMKACAPGMRDSGWGLIVNLGSMREVPEGLVAGGGRVTADIRLGAAYPTSKIAILAMTTQLAQELAEDNIVALTLNPGPAGTESFAHNARRFGFDLGMSTPVAWPAEAVRHIATCDDPMAFAATYVDAVAFAQEHGLDR